MQKNTLHCKKKKKESMFLAEKKIFLTKMIKTTLAVITITGESAILRNNDKKGVGKASTPAPVYRNKIGKTEGSNHSRRLFGA